MSPARAESPCRYTGDTTAAGGRREADATPARGKRK